MTWSELIAMGGYGIYVWTAYGFAIFILIINVVMPIRRRSIVLKALRQFIVTQKDQAK